MTDEKKAQLIREQKKYESFAIVVDKDLAIFYCCILFDIPYYHDIEARNWLEYRNLIEPSLIEKQSCFLDGETNAKDIVDRRRSDMERWLSQWGRGGETGYSEEDYIRLDDLFDKYSERLRKAGGYDAQQEDTLRSCCIMRLRSDKALAKGDKDGVDIASKLNKMIQDNLSSENLRKRDEKPVDDLRVDTIVDTLEKAGMLKKGKILALPDLQESLLRRLGALGGQPSHIFPYTLDAADQMIMAISNTIRDNDGMPEIAELPNNARLDKKSNVFAEFAVDPNEDEIQVYRELGLTREERSSEHGR